ncbi:MAG: HigA family addiction module antidote protein [Desulfobacterales bacterium]|nr:HigA family addiction module antidote protein [Desulfobacterales bacterium]
MKMYNPPHPGEIIKEFCVDACNMKISHAAKLLGVTPKTFSALVNGKTRISPEMALRLSKVFGRSPEGWLKLQVQYDLWKVQNRVNLNELRSFRKIQAHV